MAIQHLKLHPLTGNTDHDVTGLASGQILYVQNPTNGVQSTGIYTDGSGSLTASTATLTALSATTLSAGTINSGSTNLYNIFATSGQDLTTVSNGLTKSGYNVTLGGALTGTTNITGPYTLSLGTNANRLSSLITRTSGATSISSLSTGVFSSTLGLSSASSSLGFTDNVNSVVSSIIQDLTSMRLLYSDGSTQYTEIDNEISGSTIRVYDFNNDENHFKVLYEPIAIANNGVDNRFIVSDFFGQKGIVYSGDYSSNFTPESLVTKRYVDNALTSSASGFVLSVIAGSNITTGGTATSPTINLVASPSVNNFTASGVTSLQTTSGTTIQAMQFFRMIPYTDSNPASPADNDLWMHSAATGIITWNYRIGGVTKTVELG